MNTKKSLHATRGGRPVKKMVVSQTVAQEFLRFMEYHPAERLNKNLRKMVLEFLMCDGMDEGLYLKDLLYDLDGLFDLLDLIQSEGAVEEIGDR